MDLKETITNLRELEQSNKKYKGDATQYAFFRHALKLLGKLCKKEVETPIREPPQQPGEQSFGCKQCQGDGYIELWEGGSKTKREDKIIKDCDVCKGTGFVTIKVMDRRKKTKEKELYFDNKY